MTLQELKDSYKKTFTEPRLSGRYLPDELVSKFSEALDKSNTLDELIDNIDICFATDKEKILEDFKNESKEDRHIRLDRKSYHILLRILTWNDLPPIEEDKIKQTNEQ